jgi:hypothetical protein
MRSHCTTRWLALSAVVLCPCCNLLQAVSTVINQFVCVILGGG